MFRLDFQKALAFAAKYPTFQFNLLRLAGGKVRKMFLLDRTLDRPRLVAVVHQSPVTRSLTSHLIARLKEVAEDPCVLSDDPNWNPLRGVPHRSLIEGDRTIGVEAVREQMNKWSNVGRVFIDISEDFNYEMMFVILRASDLALWCVNTHTWRSALGKLKDIESKVPAWKDKIHLVWHLDDAEEVAPLAPELLELVTSDFKVSFSEPPPRFGPLFKNGLERIVHRLRGIKIGIALGGGGARGMAHLGVLKTLERNGIVVDMIAGTSAGAMTGTVYASGLDIDYSIDRFVEDLTPSWLFRQIRFGGHWHLFYKYRRGRFDPMLRKYLSDKRIEQLPIPMNTVTVDLIEGKPVARDQGDAVGAILESINLPVLSSPIFRSGQALVDGGLVNNVPADLLVSKGCNFVIAVSVTARLEAEFGRIRPDSPPGRLKYPSILQTVLRGYLVQNVNMNSVGVLPADIVIEPDVRGFDLTAFTRTDELSVRGAEATLQSITKIKTLLAQIDKGVTRRAR